MPAEIAPADELRLAAVAALLPELFTQAIWHRVRHGQWPTPQPRRTSPVPVMIVRPTRGEGK